MDISRYGKFSFTIRPEELQRGLRPSKRVPRNSGYLVECDGIVGRDGVLQALSKLTTINTSTLTATFPYPQIFVLTNVTLVCTPTDIYEYSGGTLTKKLTVTTGIMWSVVDYVNFIYMSNGIVAVIRNGLSLAYSVSSTLPKAKAMCNFNGQIVIGN